MTTTILAQMVLVLASIGFLAAGVYSGAVTLNLIGSLCGVFAMLLPLCVRRP